MNWIFGDNINTDLITPGRLNISTVPEELAKVVFLEYCPSFSKEVKSGDFVVAGRNFGCGSSRETAVLALKACQIKAVLAKSFARIFYRNCINNGLLAIITDTSNIEKDDELELDLEKRVLLNKTKGIHLQIVLPGLMLESYRAGGIIPLIKQHGLDFLTRLTE
jgi:3-isopropylmalate/(R)-2-methylmalate dehydratase small subunit